METPTHIFNRNFTRRRLAVGLKQSNIQEISFFDFGLHYDVSPSLYLLKVVGRYNIFINIRCD